MPHAFDSWACIFQPIYWPPASSSSQVFFSILHCFHWGCSFDDKLLSHSWVEVILQHCKIKAVGNLQSVVEPRSLQAVLLLNFRNFLRQTLCLTTWTVCVLSLLTFLSATFCSIWSLSLHPSFFPSPSGSQLESEASIEHRFKRSVFACYNQHGFSTVQMSNLACISSKDISLLWDHWQ